MRTSTTVVFTALVVAGIASCGDDDSSPSAKAELTSPADGARVAGAVDVVMTAKGITIEPAGEVRKDAGHFHVLADSDCLADGAAIPKDADHVHFGSGASNGTIYLGPGEHELCLQVGDGVHAATDVTDRATITVEIATQDEWCTVVGQVDELFTVMDSSSEAFPIRQVGYESIGRLIGQLEEGLDQVDAAARDDLSSTLAFAGELSAALVGAVDQAAADAAVSPIFEARGAEEAGLPAAQWIRDTCGVDIDG